MTVAFKSPLTSANISAKLISRTDNQDASGIIDFVNGLEVDGILLDKASGVLDIGDTGGIKIPDGTTAQRPSAGNGVFRYNTTNNKFEGYENGSWTNFIGSAGSRSFRAATTTDSITTGDDTVSYSGASFTATLYTAVGNAGKRVTIIHAGTSLTQVYTLATGGETIGGVASGSYALYTNGEVLELESDGANWIIINHFTGWETSVSGITVTATTTNPTKATTKENDTVYITRSGNYAELTYRYSANSAAGAAAGSGTYLYALPSGLTINSAIQPNTGSTTTENVGRTAASIDGYCSFYSTSGPTAAFSYAVTCYSTTQFFVIVQYVGSTSSGLHGHTLWPYSQVIGYTFKIRVPISGWQP